MTNEEAIADLKEALKEVDTFRKIYYKQRKVSVEYEKRYASLSFAIKALEQTRWIPISERLPMCEQEVLICAKRNTKMIITTALYEDGTMLENDSKWSWVDIDWERWDDEKDCGVIPEGWWEYRHYNPDEVYNNLVDDFIIAWMPLPQPYKVESEEEG